MKNGKRNFGLLDENFFQILIISIDMVVPMVVQQQQNKIFKLPNYYHNKPTKRYQKSFYNRKIAH